MASEVISHAIFASSHLTLHCAAMHPTMPFTLRPDPIPHRPFPSHFFAPQDSLNQVPPSTSLHLPPVHPFPIRVSPPSVFLSQAPPVDFLVRKKARFTHDMTFFHHDVRRKRFSAHEESHNMEMSSVKTTWQRSPGGGGTSGGMVAHDLVNGWQATA